MNILFIIDPIHKLNPCKDSSIAMMEAFANQACTIFVSEYQDWTAVRNDIQITATPVNLALPISENKQNWYTLGNRSIFSVTHFQLVIVRKDPPFNLDYIYLTHLLDIAEKKGIRVLNSGKALRDHPEKLSILEFPEFTPNTIVASNYEDLLTFHTQNKDIVVKPLDGMGGAGIFRIQAEDMNRGSILETLTHHESTHIMAQEYRPEIGEGDKRILIINGKVVPFCLARIPKAGELRGNLAAGGKGVAQPISQDNLKVATAISQKLAERGLFLIGLDMIGNYITEINVTSPTCFVEIFEQTGYNVASFFATEALGLVRI